MHFAAAAIAFAVNHAGMFCRACAKNDQLGWQACVLKHAPLFKHPKDHHSDALLVMEQINSGPEVLCELKTSPIQPDLLESSFSFHDNVHYTLHR